jgi:S1-C subfamily serine protease
LKTLEIADSDAIKVSHLDFELGDPFGLQCTVTASVVSSFGTLVALTIGPA